MTIGGGDDNKELDPPVSSTGQAYHTQDDRRRWELIFPERISKSFIKFSLV